MKSMRAPALLLAIPAFLAFQVAAKPLYFCAKQVCDFAATIMPCELPDFVGCEDWSAAVVTACAAEAVAVEQSGCGGCAPDPEPVVTGCCGDPSPMEIARSCGGPNTVTPISGCPKKSCDKDKDGSDGCYPDGKPVCVVCTPAHFMAERPSQTREHYIPTKILPARQASEAMVVADHIRELLHAHSPPLRVLARAGPQLVIEQCAFLL